MKFGKKEIIIYIIFFLIAATTIAAICYFYLNNKKDNNSEYFLSSIIPPQIIIEDKYVNLMFVGDIMLDRGIRYYAEKNGGNDFIFDKISSTLLDNDMVIGNLEGPITNNKSISLGTIPGSTNNYYFTFDPSWAETLYKNNIKIVNLGNNHILNFGRNGLLATKEYLNASKVGYFGTPDGPKSTSITLKELRITFISYNEFSYLPEGIEIKSTIEEIKKAKDFSDIIVVLPHWGIEYELSASDTQRALAREFIDAGADLIIGTHPHVVEDVDAYNGKMIYYSLGNFIFDQHFDENVRNSIGVKVKINTKTKNMEFTEERFYLEKNGQTISL